MPCPFQTSELTQQLWNKVKYLEDGLQRIEEITSNSSGTIFGTAVSIMQSFFPQALGTLMNMQDLFSSNFEELFTSEQMLRTCIPNMVLYSIQNSGANVINQGNFLSSELGSLSGVLSNIAGGSFNFLPNTSTAMIDNVISQVNRLSAVNLNYAIPTTMLSDYQGSVSALQGSLYNMSNFQDLLTNPISQMGGIFESLTGAYNINVNAHKTNVMSLLSSESSRKKDLLIGSARTNAFSIKDNILSLIQEKFPFSTRNSAVYEQISSLSQMLGVDMPFLANFDPSPFTPEISDFMGKQANVNPIDIGLPTDLTNNLKKIEGLFLGASSQAYNLLSKEPTIQSLIGQSQNMISDFQDQMTMNSGWSGYDYPQNTSFQEQMSGFADQIEQSGHDLFANMLRGANWSNINKIKENMTSIAGAMGDCLKQSGAELTITEQKMKALLMGQHKAQITMALTYEQALKNAADNMRVEINDTKKLIQIHEGLQG